MLTEIVWVASRIPSVRRIVMGHWYEKLGKDFQQSSWTFMNLGYAPADPAEAVVLQAQDEPNRYAIQLYHRVASGADLKGRDVLEVSSGRGGGASFIARYLAPRSVLGVDRAASAVAYCRGRHRVDGLRFERGDAERLPCADASFDAVINVEASHCYASLRRFAGEVARVLRPGGVLLYADHHTVWQPSQMRWQLRHAPYGDLLAAMAEAGLELEQEGDVTAEVVRALELDESGWRARMCRGRDAFLEGAPRHLRQTLINFAAEPGTSVHERLRAGLDEYRTARFRKSRSR